MQKIAIPRKENAGSTLDRPLTVRLTLQQRRTADLLAAQANYQTTSEFIRDLIASASIQMTPERQVA